MNHQIDSTKLIVHDEKLRNHEGRIDKLEESIGTISKLEAILEMQVEINKAQTKQLELSSVNSERTFNAINQSLSKLNYTTERLKEDTEKAQKEAEEKLEAVRAKIESDIDKRKIDTSDWGMKIFYWIIMALSTMALAWAMTQAGLN